MEQLHAPARHRRNYFGADIRSAAQKPAVRPCLDLIDAADGLERELQNIRGIDEIETRPHGWFLRCTADVRPEIVSAVTRRGVQLLQLRSEDPTLEEIYLKYFREA